MQLRSLLVSVAAATAMTASAAGAGYVEPFPSVPSWMLPVPYTIAPTGYVLEPSDTIPPFYLVNQGGPVFRTLTYAIPAYSEGGYTFSEAYPYIVSRGFGPLYSYRGYRRPHRTVLQARPYGVPAYAAYPYRAAAGARVIHLAN